MFSAFWTYIYASLSWRSYLSWLIISWMSLSNYWIYLAVFLIVSSLTFNLNSLSPVFLDIFLSSKHSSSLHNVTEVPTLPALAVRPILWMYLVSWTGSSKLTTVLTSLISSPLAAKSVANIKSNLPYLKSRKAWILWVWLRFPCNSQAFKPNNPKMMAILWHCFFVLKNTMTLSLYTWVKTEISTASLYSSVLSFNFMTCWWSLYAVF